MQARSNPTVLAARNALAELLTDPTDSPGESLQWPVRLALASAFNYLDDTLPTLAPPLLPAADRPEPADVLARVEAVRTDLMTLLDRPPAGVDVYALGHAAGELRTAARELTHGRPA